MPVTINNWNMTPPGLWRYRIPEIADATVAWVKGFYAYNDLEAEIHRRYKANGIGVPADLRQLIVEQLCQTLPEGWCNDGSLLSKIGTAISREFNRVVQGTTTLLDWWVSSGRRKVPLEEANRRAAICATCVFNAEPAGCTNCNKGVLPNLAKAIVGGEPTAYENSLQSCFVCGCALSAKVHLPLDVLKAHIKPAQLAQFPPPHPGFAGCWLRTDESATVPTP